MPPPIEREHIYNAETFVLSGSLQLPVAQEIHPQAYAKLDEKGGYIGQQAKDYRLESILSFVSAHTQVTGNREVKPGRGWTTLTTSVVEGLNILDVVTADRVVAQVSTEHPLHGYIPSITFLGTRFDNLRIAGHKVELEMDHHIIGPKPDNDVSYTKDPGFIDRICKQHAGLREHQNPIAGLLERYNRTPESFKNAAGDGESVECSLVNKAEGGYPGHSCGHVIVVPDFGVIHLATVKLEHSNYHPETHVPRKTTVHLNMIHARMGSIGTGTVTVSGTKTNGMGKP